MSCPRTQIKGSGYVKPTDPAKAAEVEKAYQDALAARFAYDSMWSPPVTYDLVGTNAEEARSTYDSFWVKPLEYDPNGSNAQPGWPSDDQSIAPLHAEPEPQWKDITIDPHEFTGVADLSAHDAEVEEIFDVSGGDCSGEPIKLSGEPIKLDVTKIKDDSDVIPFDDMITIDDSDVIELIP